MRSAPDTHGHLLWTEARASDARVAPNIATAAGRAQLDAALVAECGDRTSSDPFLLSITLGVSEGAIRKSFKRLGYSYDRRAAEYVRGAADTPDVAEAIAALPQELSPYALTCEAERLDVSRARPAAPGMRPGGGPAGYSVFFGGVAFGGAGFGSGFR